MPELRASMTVPVLVHSSPSFAQSLAALKIFEVSRIAKREAMA